MPIIRSISSTSSGDFVFVFGLSLTGKMYVWNIISKKWILHQQNAEFQPGPGTEAQNG